MVGAESRKRARPIKGAWVKKFLDHRENKK